VANDPPALEPLNVPSLLGCEAIVSLAVAFRRQKMGDLLIPWRKLRR
jgi:hypothetical protein